MKLFKFGLRIWITVVSVVVFTASWILFSHSPKPVQWPIAAPAVATLEPLPPMFGASSQQQPNNIFSFLQQNNVRPRSRSRFVTGGS